MALTFMQNPEVEKLFNYTQSMRNQVSSDYTHPIKNYDVVSKDLIIDGADNVTNLSDAKTANRNVLSFSKESTRLKMLHVNGADFLSFSP